MCLGIPGRVTSIDTEYRDLGEVEVAGGTRKINFGILENQPSVGDWVLIQSGFAIEQISGERAQAQMELLNRYTGGPLMDEDALETEEAEFDWDTMTLARANPGAEGK